MNNPRQTKNMPRPIGDPQAAGVKSESSIMNKIKFFSL
jgi:hypothetical protein